MIAAPSENRGHPVLGIGATALLAIGHSVHDALSGGHWGLAFLPAVPMTMEVATLAFGHSWLRRQGVRTVTMAALGATISALFGLAIIFLHTPQPPLTSQSVALGLAVGFVLWGLWGLTFRLPAALNEARIHVIETESLRQEAELARLRASLQPHFLLNTLNAIAGLVVDEPHEARRLLVALGDLLRDFIEEGPEVRPLAEDVAWLRRYAEILEARHHGSLHFIWEVADEALCLEVPRLLLQPLVENAVKHGALHRGEGGLVAVRARTADGKVYLLVEDNGPGIKPGTPEGLGLHLVRDRLKAAYPEATLAINSSAGGTLATIEIPLNNAPGA